MFMYQYYLFSCDYSWLIKQIIIFTHNCSFVTCFEDRKEHFKNKQKNHTVHFIGVQRKKT